MHLQPTEELNSADPAGLLQATISEMILEIARRECIARQQSMILAIADDRPALVRARDHFEGETASYLSVAINFALAHGLEPFHGMSLVDLELVRLALAPLDQKEGRV